MQTDRHIETGLRWTDRQTEKFNRHTQRHNPHAYADPGKPGKTGTQKSPPPPPPTPVKSNGYTPKIQTIFTRMLSRATKAIKWSFAGGPMTARFCGIWILSPLIILNDILHNFDFCVVQTAERVYVIVL